MVANLWSDENWINQTRGADKEAELVHVSKLESVNYSIFIFAEVSQLLQFYILGSVHSANQLTNPALTSTHEALDQ